CRRMRWLALALGPALRAQEKKERQNDGSGDDHGHDQIPCHLFHPLRRTSVRRKPLLTGKVPALGAFALWTSPQSRCKLVGPDGREEHPWPSPNRGRSAMHAGLGRTSDAPFDTGRLDRLMEEAGIDVLLATSKHNTQYLLGGYRFIFFSAMDAIGHSRYLPIVIYEKGRPERS